MKGEKKRKMPKAGAKRFGHKSHVRAEHLYRNRAFQDWMERDLVRLRRLYENTFLEDKIVPVGTI